MINTTNLIARKIQQLQPNSFESNKENTSQIQRSNVNSGLLNSYLNNLAMINIPAVKKSENTEPVNYHNNLRTMVQNNQAKILAIVMRTFNAKDTNGNDYIDGNEQNGTENQQEEQAVNLVNAQQGNKDDKYDEEAVIMQRQYRDIPDDTGGLLREFIKKEYSKGRYRDENM